MGVAGRFAVRRIALSGALAGVAAGVLVAASTGRIVAFDRPRRRGSVVRRAAPSARRRRPGGAGGRGEAALGGARRGVGASRDPDALRSPPLRSSGRRRGARGRRRVVHAGPAGEGGPLLEGGSLAGGDGAGVRRVGRSGRTDGPLAPARRPRTRRSGGGGGVPLRRPRRCRGAGAPARDHRLGRLRAGDGARCPPRAAGPPRTEGPRARTRRKRRARPRAEAGGAAGGAGAVTIPLRALSKDRDERVRLSALEGSVAMGGETALFAVEHGLDDAVWSVRLVAAELAGTVRDRRMLAPLVAALRDPRDRVADAGRAIARRADRDPVRRRPRPVEDVARGGGPSFDPRDRRAEEGLDVRSRREDGRGREVPRSPPRLGARQLRARRLGEHGAAPTRAASHAGTACAPSSTGCSRRSAPRPRAT